MFFFYRFNIGISKGGEEVGVIRDYTFVTVVFFGFVFSSFVGFGVFIFIRFIKGF